MSLFKKYKCKFCKDTGMVDGYWGKYECSSCAMGQLKEAQKVYKCAYCKDTGKITDDYWGDKVTCHYCMPLEVLLKEKAAKAKKTIYVADIHDSLCPDNCAGVKCLNCGKTWGGHNGYRCVGKKSLYETEGILFVPKVKASEKPVKKKASKPVVVEVTDDDLQYEWDHPEIQIKKKPGNNEIVTAKANELMLDYDQETIPEQFYKMMPILRERFTKGQIKWHSYHSSSGKHLHVIIILPEDIDHAERILWQSVFGSDCVREGLNILRMVKHVEHPSLLFMPVDRKVLEEGVIEPRPGRKFKEL